MDPNGPGEPALVPLERPPGRTQWTFSHAGRSYAAFEVSGDLVVTDGACPHKGGPLAEGLVRDGVSPARGTGTATSWPPGGAGPRRVIRSAGIPW